MLSADDYIVMRGNAHRAKWLNCAILAVLVGGMVVYLRLQVPELFAEGPTLVRNSGVVLGFIGVLTAYFLMNAYRKSPFSIRIGEGFIDSLGDSNDD